MSKTNMSTAEVDDVAYQAAMAAYDGAAEGGRWITLKTMNRVAELIEGAEPETDAERRAIRTYRERAA